MFHILVLCFLQIHPAVIIITETNISATIMPPITPPISWRDVPFALLFGFLLVGLVFNTEEEESVEPMIHSCESVLKI